MSDWITDSQTNQTMTDFTNTTQDLRRAIRAIERVNWYEIDGVSAVTAAMFQELLRDAINGEDND